MFGHFTTLCIKLGTNQELLIYLAKVTANTAMKLIVSSNIKAFYNPLSTNPTKWSNALNRLLADLVGLTFKGLIS